MQHLPETIPTHTLAIRTRDDAEDFIILREWPGAAQPYATHRCWQEKGSWVFEQGHYFSNLKRARRDFATRGQVLATLLINS
jgi:hypothetical protein